MKSVDDICSDCNVDNLIKKDTFYNTANTATKSTKRAVPPPTRTTSPASANADTGTTGNYFALKDMNCLRDVKPATQDEIVTVMMPDGKNIQSSYTGYLNYPHLKHNHRVHVFKTLWGSLLSIGELCDAGLIAVFTADNVYLVDTDTGTVVLTGDRDPDTRLWMIAIHPISAAQEKNALNQAQKIHNAAFTSPAAVPVVQANGASAQKLDNAGDRVEFFSRTFSSAAESTLINAVKKNWIQFPGISLATLKRNRHRLRTHESAAGHLDQVHQNHKSGPPRSSSPDSNDDKSLSILTHVYEERNHMDATGRFPVMSHAGHEYQLIMYSEGSNYIKVLPMKNRSKTSYLSAHKEGLAWFEEHGYKPTFQRLDNETSQDFATHLRSNGIKIDLAPPHMHRRNKAERAIRTWKNHFIATLAGLHPNFPMCAWNELIPQAEITINLLRESPTHPRQSAWEAINGAYDFDAHPMAPPGTAVTVHEKPAQRQSWSKHGVPGFYVGPAMQYYRCYSVWVTHTGTTRTTDTVAWHPHAYRWEEYSPLEMVSSIADALGTALQHLADNDTHTAAERQPIQHIAHDIQTNFEALKAAFTPLEQRVPETHDTTAPQLHQDIITPALPQQPQQSASQPPQTDAVEPQPQLDHTPLQRVEDTTPLQRVVATPLPQEQQTPAPVQRVQEPEQTKPPPASAKRYSAQQKKQPAQRRSTRQKHLWLNRANQIVQTRSDWAAWSRQSRNIALDSHGVPFFLPQQHAPRHSANTAVDLDSQGKKLSITTALAGEDGHLWLEKHGEEITRLFKSDTIKLIHWNDLPSGKKPAYYNPQVRTKIKEGKLQRRVRGTIGGDQISFDGDTAAHTASMQLIKILLNAVVSDPKAKFMTADIKDFYLGTPLPTVEYMRIKLDHIPQSVIDQHGMAAYARNGAVIVAVHKGIYGLPQAGILAQDRLVAHLAEHGYIQATNTPCLFKHITNSVTFTLVVDDFGIKYTHQEDADHLLLTLRKLYEMTEDRAATQKYVGITIAHDRSASTITLSMPGYVEKALKRFGTAEQLGAKSPLIYTPPLRGPEGQFTSTPSAASLHYVDAKTKTFVQEVTGVFLFYSRAVDPTMLTAVNKISMEQAKPTVATLKAIDRLLSYAARYPNATVVFKPSNMQLCGQSDASYISETGARSRAGGILHFGLNRDGSVNGAIDYMSCVIHTVCSSVAEAEYAALFLLGREATSARNILMDLGYPQDTTTLICDNECAVGLATDSVKQKRSKAIDMRYHWIRDQVRQGKFKVKWEQGASNLADYFTKAHPVHHYVTMRHLYVTTPKPLVIRQCARSRRISHRKTHHIISQ